MLLKLGKHMQHIVWGFKEKKGKNVRSLRPIHFYFCPFTEAIFLKVLSSYPVTNKASAHICVRRMNEGRESFSYHRCVWQASHKNQVWMIMFALIYSPLREKKLNPGFYLLAEIFSLFAWDGQVMWGGEGRRKTYTGIATVNLKQAETIFP